MFRKPKRNVRQRQVDDDDSDDVETKTEEDPKSLEELQSNIAKFKEKKSNSNKNISNKAATKKSNKNNVDENGDDKKVPVQLLSFDEDLLTGGETFKTWKPKK